MANVDHRFVTMVTYYNDTNAREYKEILGYQALKEMKVPLALRDLQGQLAYQELRVKL